MTEANKPLDKLHSTDQSEEYWEEKKLAALLEAASIAIKRARYVFILINIAAILIFTAEFNALFPWLRNVLKRDNVDPGVIAIVRDALHKELEIVAVPLLGIKFSTFDLTVLGSLAALLLAIWFYYSVRRENLVVSEICRIAAPSSSKEKRAYLYHGIAHYFVYTTASKREGPEGFTPQTTARAVVRALFFVPAWLPLLIVLSDLLSIILPSEVSLKEVGCESLWCVLVRYRQQYEAIGRMGFAVILSLFSFSQCWGAYTWDKSTRLLVEKLQRKVEAERG
jgi:hypothetical protein